MTTNGAKKTPKENSLVMDDIQKLVTMLDKSGLHELEVEVGGTKVRLAKPAPLAAPVVHMSAPMPQMAHPHVPAQMSIPAPTPATAEAAPAALAAPARSSSAVELKSPMVGTFYRAAGPGADPFVKVGDRVKKGQVICIIEAMKLMNEIEAEMDGVVSDILAENAKPVEYGEVLMHIEPA